MPGVPLGQSYIPQIRLHMHHCILKDTFFPFILTNIDDHIRGRMADTADSYNNHHDGYEEILALKETRPLPLSKTYAG